MSSILENINSTINEVMSPITDTVCALIFYSVSIGGYDIPLILVWLIGAALFCTLYFRFINFRGFKLAIDIVRGKYDFPNQKISGQVSHFQALTTALSGTLGLGNIAGVAIAIAVGGPGATFWMIVAGFLGMSSKFVECTLGVKYRNENEDGSVSGGPMYYLSKGLGKRGWKHTGKIFAAVFAVMCVGGALGGGNMIQVNQARVQFSSLSWLFGEFWTTDQGALLFGVLIAVVTGAVVLGGINTIAKVTDKLVPFMCALYVLAAIVILFFFYEKIPSAFESIFYNAFTLKSAFGGVVGAMIQGFRRAAFSNEAGIGSAAIAHSAVKTDEPITEGLVSLLEPFIDTVLICTMTALVLVITGAYTSTEAQGVQMTALAFDAVFGTAGNVILTVAVLLFAFSTIISWGYYGLKSWTYLFGEKKIFDVSYKIMYCVFVVIGSVMSLQKVVDFSDAMIFAMSIPNVIALIVLAPEVKKDLAVFMNKIKSGEIRRTN